MQTYLGDGVYASDELNPGHITLTTGNHQPELADNIIHLDSDVRRALSKLFLTLNEAEVKAHHAEIINLIPEDLRYKASSYQESQIDIDNLDHDDTMRVMRALNAGRWDRKESGVEGKLDYVATVNGLTVRLWAAAPPDSCRVVEEEYEIPATRAVRKRIICREDERTDAVAPAPPSS